ncbi:MAG: hypothetical protein LC627_03750, partial [Verrucomicrobiaceae bacterium]|nr:hypothetical protein [Verrucomicrobiaceae bacterium]
SRWPGIGRENVQRAKDQQARRQGGGLSCAKQAGVKHSHHKTFSSIPAARVESPPFLAEEERDGLHKLPPYLAGQVGLAAPDLGETIHRSRTPF